MSITASVPRQRTSEPLTTREKLGLAARGALLLALAVFVAMAVQAESSPLALGEKAPPAHFVSYDGKGWGLEQFEGRPMLLSFWAPWCAPCMAEMPMLVDFAHEHREDVVVVGAVVNAEPKRVFEAIRRFEIPFPVAAADPGTIGRYHADAVPLTYLLDAEHRVVWSARGMTSHAQLSQAVRALRP
jgi:cytochrome c biogenesis protein CcmG/thiol:disulfide interchange protein DsbE